MDSTGCSQVGLDPAVKNCNPAQRKPHVLRRAEVDIRLNLQIFEVYIRLIKAVEQHHPVDACLIQPLCKIGHITEERAQFDSHRDVNDRFDGLDDIDVGLFHFRRSLVYLGRNPIHIQLERIRPSLLDLFCIVDPTSNRRAVEARNDRDAYRFFRIAYFPEILFRTCYELGRLGEK